MSDEKINLTPWYFIRHAPAEESEKGLYSDPDVNAKLPDETVIRTMADQLPHNADWYVSPLKRTRTTANSLIKVLDEEINHHICDEITEQDFGAWQGLSFDQLWNNIEEFPAHNWSLLAANTRPPEGESFEDVIKRVSNFIDGISVIEPERPKIIVSHAGVIRAAVGYILGLSADRALSFEIKPFSLSRILHQTGEGRGGKWQVNYLNRIFEVNSDE